jgi:hypothetical protein
MVVPDSGGANFVDATSLPVDRVWKTSVTIARTAYACSFLLALAAVGLAACAMYVSDEVENELAEEVLWILFAGGAFFALVSSARVFLAGLNYTYGKASFDEEGITFRARPRGGKLVRVRWPDIDRLTTSASGTISIHGADAVIHSFGRSDFYHAKLLAEAIADRSRKLYLHTPALFIDAPEDTASDEPG